MASVRAPATPSRANSRTAARRIAARLCSGHPREPMRDLEATAFMRKLSLINQLVRLYTSSCGWANSFRSNYDTQRRSGLVRLLLYVCCYSRGRLTSLGCSDLQHVDETPIVSLFVRRARRSPYAWLGR